MKFTMKQLQELIVMAKADFVTPDPYLNSQHDASTKLIGHTNPYYPLFYLISKTFQPAMVVELGSWRAYGASHFAGGNPAGKVATIDIHKDDPLAQQLTLEAQAHYGNLRYFHSWTWDAVPLLLEHYGKLSIDVLFIDAWHTYEYAMREWKLFGPYMADNSLVICDDLFNAAGACENMIQWWEDFQKDSHIKESFLDGGLHPGVPMGFARYVKNG